MTYRCLLVDDEYLAMDLLEEYINRTPHLEIAAKINKPSEALLFMQRQPIDILFLDIEMPGMNGISLLDSIVQKPAVIFTTAHRAYAFEGYDFGIADYLLKPIRWERFSQAVHKAKMQIRGKRANSPANENETLTVSSGKEKERIPLAAILFIKASKDYSIIYTQDKKHVLKKNLGQLEEMLAGSNIMRIHKSYLVPKERVRLIKNNIILIDAYKIPIGRKYKQVISSMLH